MTMESDVKATRLSASGAVWSQRTRVRGIAWVGGASAGTLVFKNGGSGGTTFFTVDTPAGATLSGYHAIPGRGVLFPSDCYCTITNTAFVTIYYEGQ